MILNNPASPSILGVVPVLIGPAQVLLAIIPAIALAILGRIVARFKPSALKATALLLWKKKIAVIIVIILIVLAVYAWLHMFPATHRGTAQASRTNADWAMSRGTPDRRALAGTPTADPDSGGVIWSFSKGFSAFYASPAIAGNALYITGLEYGQYTDKGAVFCLNAQTGDLVWRFSPSNYRATYSSPVVSGKYLVVGEGFHTTPACRITCLDADTGQKLWDVTTTSKVEPTPCIYNGKAYCGAGDDGFYCIALKPGPNGKANVLWHLPHEKYPDCDSSPVAFDGKIYWGCGVDGQAVVCVDAETGQEKWRDNAPYPVFSSPTIYDGKVFVGMGNGNLINSAEVVRDLKIAKMKAAGASQADLDATYKALAPGGAVWALDAQTGNKAWEHPLNQTVLGVIAAADNRLYFGCQDGFFRCLTTDGKLISQWNARDAISNSPAIGVNHVYFTTNNGELIALDRKTFQPVWQTTTGAGGLFLSSPVLSDGHIYIGTGANGVICTGEPNGTTQEPIWSGPQGAAGKGGWIDGAPLPATGTFAWRYPAADANAQTTSAPAMSAPALKHKDAIYAAISDGSHHDLSKLVPAKDGKKANPIWSYPTTNAVIISPVADESQIYISDGKPGDANRKIAAVNLNTGKPAWTHPIAPGASGATALLPDRLIVMDQPDAISCLALTGDNAGKPLWTRPVKSPIGSPAILDDIVLISRADDPAILALDCLTGSILWQAPLPSRPTTGPIASATQDFNRVAVGTDHGLVALNIPSPDSNPIAWTLPIGPIAGPMICDANRIIATNASGDLTVASWDGKSLATLKGAIPGFALIAGDDLLFATAKTLEHFDLTTADGHTPPQPALWMKIDWLGHATAAPFLSDSFLYFGTDQKGLVCIKPKK